MNKDKVTLVTGASGYVGAAIYKSLKDRSYKVFGTYNKTKLFDELICVDLTDEEKLYEVINIIKPDVIIHCAADAHTASCERDPENAHKLNVEATKSLVDYAKTNRVRFIQISTFACFDENSKAIYNKTKIEAENLVKTLEQYVILRLSIVTGLSPNTSSKNFYNDLIKAYRGKHLFEADSSWKFETTYLGYAVEVLGKIIDDEKINKLIIPVVVKGVTSRFELATKLLQGKGIAVNESNNNRILPLPNWDETIYMRLGVKQMSLDEAIIKMKVELDLQVLTF